MADAFLRTTARAPLRSFRPIWIRAPRDLELEITQVRRRPGWMRLGDLGRVSSQLQPIAIRALPRQIESPMHIFHVPHLRNTSLRMYVAADVNEERFISEKSIDLSCEKYHVRDY